MELRKIFMGLSLLSIPMIFIDKAIALGWLIGQLSMIALEYGRSWFYSRLLEESKFSVRMYVAYIICVLALIIVPLLIAFFKPNIINPYAVFAAFLLDRLITFIFNSFKRERSV